MSDRLLPLPQAICTKLLCLLRAADRRDPKAQAVKVDLQGGGVVAGKSGGRGRSPRHLGEVCMSPLACHNQYEPPLPLGLCLRRARS